MMSEHSAGNTRLSSRVSLRITEKPRKCQMLKVWPWAAWSRPLRPSSSSWLLLLKSADWFQNETDGIFQVTVAAEACDYAALIMIAIFNQCRKVLFWRRERRQTDCLHEMRVMGAAAVTPSFCRKTRRECLQVGIRRSRFLQVAVLWCVGLCLSFPTLGRMLKHQNSVSKAQSHTIIIKTAVWGDAI